MGYTYTKSRAIRGMRDAVPGIPAGCVSALCGAHGERAYFVSGALALVHAGVLSGYGSRRSDGTVGQAGKWSPAEPLRKG
jgi:hypothetical protein